MAAAPPRDPPVSCHRCHCELCTGGLAPGRCEALADSGVLGGGGRGREGGRAKSVAAWGRHSTCPNSDDGARDHEGLPSTEYLLVLLLGLPNLTRAAHTTRKRDA